MRKYTNAFTLVELLVVMTLLAILGTISVIGFGKYVSTTRDTVRMSDIRLIQKKISFFQTEHSILPLPDNGIEISYSGATFWTQGTFGQSASSQLRMNEILDPLYEVPYSYSLTSNRQEYQISNVVENLNNKSGQDSIAFQFFPSVNAASVTSANVVGNYNGIFVGGEYEDILTFIASPSIIATDISNSNIIDIITGQKLVFDGFFNLPATYSGVIDNLSGGFYFNVSDPIVYTGSLDDLKTETSLSAFQKRLKYVYSVTPTESFDKYITVLEEQGYKLLKDLLTRHYYIFFKDYFSCFDILQEGVSSGDGYYPITTLSDEGGKNTRQVYCDMTIDGGGWTLRDDIVYFTDGDFGSGADMVSLIESSGNNDIINTISNPIDSQYVIHQTGGADSKYVVGLLDQDSSTPGLNIPTLQPGDELRLSLWVSDNNTSSWNSCLDIACDEGGVPGYMFHNRIFYSDGENSVNGFASTIETQTIDGRVWEHKLLRKKIRKSLSDFQWYIGYGAEDTTDLYFTGVDIQVFSK